MKPDFKIKIHGKILPVFRTPVSENQLHDLLLEGKTNRFFIHNQKTGKLKEYNFNDKMPERQILNIDLGYSTIGKLFFSGILSYYTYKLIKWSPIKKRAPISTEEYMSKLHKKYPPSKKEKKSSVSSSPNGWVIEELN